MAPYTKFDCSSWSKTFSPEEKRKTYFQGLGSELIARRRNELRGEIKKYLTVKEYDLFVSSVFKMLKARGEFSQEVSLLNLYIDTSLQDKLWDILNNNLAVGHRITIPDSQNNNSVERFDVAFIEKNILLERKILSVDEQGNVKFIPLQENEISMAQFEKFSLEFQRHEFFIEYLSSWQQTLSQENTSKLFSEYFTTDEISFLLKLAEYNENEYPFDSCNPVHNQKLIIAIVNKSKSINQKDINIKKPEDLLLCTIETKIGTKLKRLLISRDKPFRWCAEPLSNGDSSYSKKAQIDSPPKSGNPQGETSEILDSGPTKNTDQSPIPQELLAGDSGNSQDGINELDPEPESGNPQGETLEILDSGPTKNTDQSPIPQELLAGDSGNSQDGINELDPEPESGNPQEETLEILDSGPIKNTDQSPIPQELLAGDSSNSQNSRNDLEPEENKKENSTGDKSQQTTTTTKPSVVEQGCDPIPDAIPNILNYFVMRRAGELSLMHTVKTQNPQDAQQDLLEGIKSQLTDLLESSNVAKSKHPLEISAAEYLYSGTFYEQVRPSQLTVFDADKNVRLSLDAHALPTEIKINSPPQEQDLLLAAELAAIQAKITGVKQFVIKDFNKYPVQACMLSYFATVCGLEPIFSPLTNQAVNHQLSNNAKNNLTFA